MCWEAAKFIGNLMKGVDAGTKQRYRTEPARGAAVTGIRDSEAGKVRNGRPVGEWAVRVDKSDPGTRQPHINTNEKLVNKQHNLSGANKYTDPHTKISSKTLGALKTTGQTIDAISKVAKSVAIATDAVRLGAAVQQDGGTVGENTITTAGSVAGGWGGAWAGAAIGAKGGAIVGSFFGPGPGTAIGGFVGGLGGGIIGSFVGSEVGEAAARAAVPLIIEEDKK